MALPRSQGFFPSEVVYRVAGTGSVLLFITLVLSLILSLLWNSRLSLKAFGLSFIGGSRWHAPYFEPSNGGLRPDDNAFLLRFSQAPVNPQLIQIHQNGAALSFSMEEAGRGILFFPSEEIDGSYTFFLPSALKNEEGQSLGADIQWQATVREGEIIEQSFLSQGSLWEPLTDENTRIYGILPFIIGSVASSLLALLLAVPTALAAALTLTDFTRKNSPWARAFTTLIDLLAGIPSIIYGMWGLFFLVPLLGANLLSASLILSIMTVPYAASLMAESIRLVPDKIRQAGLALGASHSRLIFQVVLPYARSGIIAGILLSLGRALGETLAVTMVIGNRNAIPASLTDPAQTIASLIANEYGEAAGLKQSALIEAGFVLIIITILFSLIGRWIIRAANQGNRP